MGSRKINTTMHIYRSGIAGVGLDEEWRLGFAPKDIALDRRCPEQPVTRQAYLTLGLVYLILAQ